MYFYPRKQKQKFLAAFFRAPALLLHFSIYLLNKTPLDLTRNNIALSVHGWSFSSLTSYRPFALAISVIDWVIKCLILHSMYGIIVPLCASRSEHIGMGAAWISQKCSTLFSGNSQCNRGGACFKCLISHSLFCRHIPLPSNKPTYPMSHQSVIINNTVWLALNEVL